MSNVYDIEHYRMRRENDCLGQFIIDSLSDPSFFAVHVHLIKCCIAEWHDTETKLQTGNRAATAA